MVKYVIGFCLCICWHVTQAQSIQTDTQKVVVSRIVTIGNKVTRQAIINRELIFHVGDTLPLYVLNSAIARSKENLMNTFLFNFVEIDAINDADNKKQVIVKVTERWYLFPVPIFELADRNFNEWWQTKDFSRTIYGFYAMHQNFRGRKELLQLSARFGYAQKFNINYVVPYINKSQNNGLQFTGGYNRNHEVSYTLENSKFDFYTNDEKFIRKEWFAAAKYTIRKGIYQYTNLAAEYRYASIDTTVLLLNPNYFLPNKTFTQYIALNYKFVFDKRDYRLYSSKGSYFDFELGKVGLGILQNEPNLIFATGTYKNTCRLAQRWHYSYAIKGRVTGPQKAPYYNQRALGYFNDMVRTYELYVINGQHFGLYKSNLRFTLLPQKTVQLPVITDPKFGLIPFAFYLNLFADLGYVHDDVFQHTNPLANELLPGVGVGLDLVTYYNMVIRVEYGVNRKGEAGLFLNFTNALY